MLTTPFRRGPRRRPVALLGAALLLATLAPARVALAQADSVAVDGVTGDSTRHCGRCLNGHRFLFTSLVPDPFVTTHFRNGTGGGSVTNLTVEVRNLEGTVLDSIAADIGFFTLDFEYQYRVTRWLGLHATATTLARIGTSGASVLASGVSALYGTSLGATVRVWGSDAVQLSLTGDARRNQVWVIDPYRFAQSVSQGDDFETSRSILLRAQTSNRYVGGARGAWAPTSWLGFNGTFEAGSGEIPTPNGGWESVAEWGLMASFDANPLWRVPVGLWTGYRGQSGSGRVSDLSGSLSTYGGGLLYTGRPNYLIGVDVLFGKAYVNEASLTRVDLVQGRIVTRFDF